MTLTPGISVVKLFVFVTIHWANKLEPLYLQSFLGRFHI
jgi:hypothetical protein